MAVEAVEADTKAEQQGQEVPVLAGMEAMAHH